MRCAHVIMPPRGIKSGGNENVSIKICGSKLASAVVVARNKTELAPINAMLTSSQANIVGHPDEWLPTGLLISVFLNTRRRP